MGSFRALVERQRADPIAAEFLSVASSAIRLRALRFSPLLPITIAPHHHENVRFRAARHLRYVRFGSFASQPVGGRTSVHFRSAPKPDVNSRARRVWRTDAMCHERTHAPQQTASDAVGTRVTSRPPHKTVRAAFPHTAPTSGV